MIMVGGNYLDSGASLNYFQAYYYQLENLAKCVGIKSLIITNMWFLTRDQDHTHLSFYPFMNTIT